MKIKNKTDSQNKDLNKKGQIVVYDFMFGFITFIIIITVITLLWFSTTAKVSQENEQETRLKIAHDITAILSQTQGKPARWELEDATFLKNTNFSIGLAIDNNVLSQNKVNRFMNMNDTALLGYDGVKQLLNIPNYDYYIKIRDVKNNILNRTGINPLSNLSSTVTRKVLIDGEVRSLEVTIY